MQPLEIHTHVEHGHTVITPRGEIDLVSQSDLKKLVNDLVVEGQVDLVVDLGETTFLDSTALGALIGARRLTHTFKGSFALICAEERLLKLFRITSLDKFFAIHESRASLFANLEPDGVGQLAEGQPA
jgi:anti-sigma B factor antagonist